MKLHQAAMNLHTALVELSVDMAVTQVSKHHSEVLVWVKMLMHTALAVAVVAVAATNRIHLNKHLLNKQIFFLSSSSSFHVINSKIHRAVFD